jgi:hypothetical protein
LGLAIGKLVATAPLACRPCPRTVFAPCASRRLSASCFRFFRSLRARCGEVEIVKAAGYKGLVVVIDEAETILWMRKE